MYNILPKKIGEHMAVISSLDTDIPGVYDNAVDSRSDPRISIIYNSKQCPKESCCKCGVEFTTTNLNPKLTKRCFRTSVINKREIDKRIGSVAVKVHHNSHRASTTPCLFHLQCLVNCIGLGTLDNCCKCGEPASLIQVYISDKELDPAVKRIVAKSLEKIEKTSKFTIGRLYTSPCMAEGMGSYSLPPTTYPVAINYNRIKTPSPLLQQDTLSGRRSTSPPLGDNSPIKFTAKIRN